MIDIIKLANLDKDSLFVDIGGHDGSVCKKVMDVIGCRAAAWEPNIRQRVMLLRLERLYPWFTYYPYAVGAKEESGIFHDYGLDGGADSLFKRVDTVERKYPWHERYSSSIKVEKMSFSAVVSQFSKIDFCNMDCEGSEMEILMETAAEDLQKVGGFLVEFHVFDDFEIPQTDEDVKQVVDRMESIGFTAEKLGDHPDYLFRRQT